MAIPLKIPRPVGMPDYRRTGALLLLTALATAISVVARLSANADATPFTDAVAQAHNLDAATISAMVVSEKLDAIGAAATAYGAGGAARLIGGLTLLAAARLLWRVLGAYHRPALGAAALLLAASGIASAVSGGAAVSLAALAPEPQSISRLAAAGSLDHGTGDALLTLRWFAGALGFALAGLGLIALSPAQWRMGGILRITAIVDAILGLAMLFIWVDAATVIHRITGIGFLIWLIISGLWLLRGTINPPPNPPPKPI